MNQQVVILKGKKVTLREYQINDLPILWELIYADSNPEWKKWDAPYFPLNPIEKKAYIAKAEESLKRKTEPQNQLIIEADNKIIGTVTYYWENEATRWLEMGIVIYRPEYWNGGYGTESIKLWIDYLFESIPAIERVGYSTWSGNIRMVKVGEKLGMTMEGRMRKCRYYNGVYYDSIRMGLLREEWKSANEID
ncbi:GNAT family N-acetyltransferase [Fredinandcohnia quinoae]|uniref:GNAT family N-acetyltransferase n=1 Tax=Fredinandcohnia quinoae TaxID=2918902 RepID=A0AAW5E583_9BACI|nr:GNAT family protein [Fredinandcohnia sp. SECRCQ15]MCH1626405.1 GNAT family N-acetyltransferase [Fredinandcohnia sp. SECRCQ15]